MDHLCRSLPASLQPSGQILDHRETRVLSKRQCVAHWKCNTKCRDRCLRPPATVTGDSGVIDDVGSEDACDISLRLCLPVRYFTFCSSTKHGRGI